MTLVPQKFREIVFHLLYSIDFNGQPLDQEAIDLLMKYHKVPKKTVYQAYDQLKKVQDHLSNIDQMLKETVRDYEFERIPRVERNVLRLGIYEMYFNSDIPDKVAICEGMRLARKFSTKESANFINAIFDALYKKKNPHEL